MVFADLDGNKNVLAAAVTKKMYLLRKKLGEINVGVSEKVNSTWQNTCNINQAVCQEGHILEIWAVNKTFNADSETAVNSLSDQVCLTPCSFCMQIHFTWK